jgi:hypothetical protein
MKATSLGHPRHNEARPQNKASNISFQHFNRHASGDHLGTEARRLEGAGPIYMNLSDSPLMVSQLGIDPTNKTRRHCVMTFPSHPWPEWRKVNWLD